MTARGVRKAGSKTLSYAVRGEIDDSAVNLVLGIAGGVK